MFVNGMNVFANWMKCVYKLGKGSFFPHYSDHHKKLIMTMKNNVLSLIDVLASKGEKKLTPNSNSTVQPVALMRLGLFVPSLKRKGKNVESVTIDASEELSKLEIAQAEGYSNITISGPRLSMETDFKVWVAVILSFSKYGRDSNTIELPFSEFASFAGYPDKEKTRVLRERISGSLTRIRSTTLSLSSKNKDKHSVTGLLQKGNWDVKADVIKLTADESLWELYQVDNQVLLQMFVLRKLANKGTAQALYTFIESLPRKPIPLSFERIKQRLVLTSPQNQQNRIIKKAVEELIDTGYLDATIQKRDKDWHVLIHGRNPKCHLPAGASLIEGLDDD